MGRYCEYVNIDVDRSNEFDTFEEYKETLRLECDEGEAGTFWWIPDDSVPDIVYFQVIYGLYSGTPLLWTPWGPGEVSCIERCPRFRSIEKA